jgi:hypothetical protein
MLRDVLVAQISKGQFPLFIMGVISSEIVWKMPPGDVSKLVFRLLDAAEVERWGGYGLSLVITFAWFFHGRYQRRLMTGEIARTSEQKTRVQERVLGSRIKSSEEEN